MMRALPLSLRSFAKRFAVSRKGTVAMIYGLALLPTIAAVGCGVDMTRALVLAMRGDADGARGLLTPDLTGRLWPDLQYAYFVAQAYVGLGDHAEALRWLEQSVRRGFVHHPYLNGRDPLLAPLRADAGFRGLMVEVGHEWSDLQREAALRSPRSG